jgi:hypothetical protein
MIEEDYVSFECAKLLREKGFDGECMSMYVTPKPHSGMGNPNEAKIAPHGRDSHYYDGYTYQCEAPTLQMVRKWLREKHHLHIEVRITNHSISSMVNVVKYYWVMCNTETGRWCDESTVYNVRAFDKSEEAEEDAIRHALEKI